MLFFAEIERPRDILTAIEQFVINAIPAVLVPTVLVLLVVGIFAYFHYRRERLLRHQERMAMIQAGIDPDYPPVDPPKSPAATASKETGDYRPKNP